jgi:hypothetical protein
MTQIAIVQSSYRPLAPHSLIRSRPGRKTSAVVYSFKKDGNSGIHDPSGPSGSWGAGEGKSRQERMAQEESFRVGKEDLDRKDIRSDQKLGHHPPGHSAVDRPAAVAKELQEMEEEKADDEYAHLGGVQKKLMKVKNALYSFLKSGYEPL